MNPKPLPPFSEQLRECADRLARRGMSALEDLYDLTASRLVRYAQTLTGNQTDAEDALQATMVRLAMHPEALSGAVHHWAYLLRILRNVVFRQLQKQSRQQNLTHELSATEVDVSQGIDEADQKEIVHQALEKLPREQAEVVVLKIWEEMTFAEIAEVLEESANTVASRYRYAIQKLTQLLQTLSDEVTHD